MKKREKKIATFSFCYNDVMHVNEVCPYEL